ncbi:DMT family transporter [Rhodovibrionaceae bacterium A322]
MSSDGKAQSDQPIFAALLIVGTYFFLAFQDALIKTISSDLSLWQFMILRAGLNCVFFVIIARIFWRGESLLPKRLWAVALRCAFLVGALTLYFGAIPFLPLAELAAGLFVYPLFIGLLSALFLGEKVGPRRILAILAGLGGTLLILKPGSDGFTYLSLFPVASGLFFAANILTIRRLCRQESPLVLAYSVSLTYLLVGSCGLVAMEMLDWGSLTTDWPYIFTGWHEPGLWVLGIILLCSSINSVTNIAMAKAYQSAESSWLAPFDYSYLVFATAWGYLLFDSIPDALSFLGMALIAGGGVYLAWREKQVAKKAQA